MRDQDGLSRILELESKLAYQDVAIDELDSQVQKLNLLVERMEVYCSKIEQRLQELQSTSIDQHAAIHNERPPHY